MFLLAIPLCFLYVAASLVSKLIDRRAGEQASRAKSRYSDDEASSL